MPTYIVTAPDGRKFDVTGDSPPTEKELEDIYAAMSGGEGGKTKEEAGALAEPTIPPDSMSRMGGKEMATTAAYGGQLANAAGPVVNQAAQFVAKSPAAQKVIAHGIGAATGELLGGYPGAMVGTVMSEPLREGVGKVAGKLASATGGPATRAFTMRQAIRGTVGYSPRDPVTGQFTKVLPSALKSVLEKIGPAMGMMSGESAALENLNSPESVSKLLQALPPDEQAQLVRQLPASMVPDDWKRSDGSKKGAGYLGMQRRDDGGVSSEISIGVNLDGKEVEIPTMVPTLTLMERQWLLHNDISDPSKIPQSIKDKAVAFARQRKAEGKPYFAQAGESR